MLQSALIFKAAVVMALLCVRDFSDCSSVVSAMLDWASAVIDMLSRRVFPSHQRRCVEPDQIHFLAFGGGAFLKTLSLDQCHKFS